MKHPFILSLPALLIFCTITTAQEQKIDTALQGASKEKKRLPDPRFRRPLGLWEIDVVASKIASKIGKKVSGKITEDTTVALANIRGPLSNSQIRLNPKAAMHIPPNSWAFIIGHEFAHLSHNLGLHGTSTPQEERKADSIGARYAMAAGFDLTAHVAWMLSQRNSSGPTHGSFHQRALRLAKEFKVPRAHIDRCLHIYSSR